MTKRYSRNCWLALTGCLILLAGLSGCDWLGSKPTDAQLIQEFNLGRADYNRLLTMFQEDCSLGRVAPDFTRPANFFSGARLPECPLVTDARLKEYRELFDRLSLDAGIEGYDGKEVIEFYRYSEGMGGGLGGSGKGLAFISSVPPDKPTQIGCETPRSHCARYRPLGGGWFISSEKHN